MKALEKCHGEGRSACRVRGAGGAVLALLLLLSLAPVAAPGAVTYPLNQVPLSSASPAWSVNVGNTASTVGYQFSPTVYVSVKELGVYPAATYGMAGKTLLLSLWKAPYGPRLASTTITVAATPQWQFAALADPVLLTPGEEYTVSYFWDGGTYNAYSVDMTAEPNLTTFGPTGTIEWKKNVIYPFGDGSPFFATGYSYLADIGYELAYPVFGVCGSANGVSTTTEPTTDLCSSGTESAVSTGTNSFTWTCTGSDGGTDAQCEATRLFTVTATTVGGNGSISCDSPVAGGTTGTCTATPDLGYRTVSISGCGGTSTSAGTDSYTTGAISEACEVTASFEPIPLHAVTASAPGGNGTITCDSPVAEGSSATCTATPNRGYRTVKISGCGGTSTPPGATSYTTGAISGPCEVIVTFDILRPVPALSGWAQGALTLLLLGLAGRHLRRAHQS